MNNFFSRSSHNPILKPNPQNKWENFKVYNAGAFLESSTYHLFYRAMNRGEDWASTIGHAISKDGEHFERVKEPVLVPESPEEKRGLEDPRVTKVGDTYFMSYAAYDGDDVRLHIATSSDLHTWTKRGRALKDFGLLKNGGHRIQCDHGKILIKDKKAVGKERSKSSAMFPEKINEKYWMVFGELSMWLATSDDGIQWDVLPGVFLSARENHFDNAFVETGPTPIKTEKGWLVLYHGIDNWKTYRIGILLLDLDDPTKVVYRSEEPIFEPEGELEISGYVDVLPGGLEKIQSLNDDELKKFIADSVEDKTMNAVVFCCGAVVEGDTLRIYYGAGDSYICTATTALNSILKLAD